jgi:CheY-like chemotaxis protein
MVDDSEDNCYLIRSHLKQTPITVVTAENGRTGVDLFRTGRYDAVLMDVEIPVMDGYAAVREIRRIEQETGAPPTPVFALTAHAYAGAADRAKEAGFTGVLTKPIRRGTLMEALGTMEALATIADRGGQSPLAEASPGPEAAGVPVPIAAGHPIRIQVEEGMEDVVSGYLGKRRAEIPVYPASLAGGDFDAIKKLAHKMKGTGWGYGFPRLTELGGALESAAIRKDALAARENLEELALYLSGVELEFTHQRR